MKTDKEISESYIESAEKHLIENDVYSIEKAVVHYKRAILFDPKNIALRKWLNEVFYEVSKRNKLIENEDIEKNLIIKKFLSLFRRMIYINYPVFYKKSNL